MGTPIAIVGSVDTGHDPFSPGVGMVGEPLFTVNGIPVMCTGDAMSPHVHPLVVPTHVGTVIGSSMITINGRVAAKVGDVTGCGATLVSGLPLFTTD